MTSNIDPIFSPRSIAVIGASRKRGTIGAEIFHNLLSHNYQGVAYPVNGQADFVQAVRAYPTVLEIPDEVDLAVVSVPKQFVLTVAKECVAKKVKAMVVITAGFRELGAEGQRIEKELVQICKDAGIRLVGPNCLGVLNTDPETLMDATFAPTFPPHGNVAFSSQSGALGLTILDYAQQLGIGISKFVSVGNKADVSGNDLLEYWEHDPKTDVILFYLESFGNPKRFREVAARVGRKKPIVAVKSGRSKTGAKAASSHTGSLAGSEAAVDALFRQTGVIRVDTVEELFDMSMLLANQPLPKGDRVGILTNAGGPGIMAADACEAWGLVVPELDAKVQAEIRKFLPQEASVRNPVDMIASAPVEAFRSVIPVMLKDPSIDSLLVIYVPPIVTKPVEVAHAIVQGAAGTDKPVVSCFMGTHGVPEGLRSLKAGKVPSYAFPEAAVAAIARASHYAEWKERPTPTTRSFSDFNMGALNDLKSRSGWLSQKDAFTLLDSAGIPMVTTRFAKTESEAAAKAQEIGYPVVLKVDSPNVLHKTEVGGVVVNIPNEAELKKHMQRLREKLGQTEWVVQKFAKEGVETIVGMTTSDKVGPLFVFGLGGIQTEVLKDVTHRLHPLTTQDAHEMVNQIKGLPLLTGFRGAPPCDIQKVEETLLRLSQLVSVMPQVVEFDLNPVRVLEASKGITVLDARIRLEPKV